MKQFEIKSDKLLKPSSQDMANLFNLYSGQDGKLYFNINRTLVVKGLENPMASLYDFYTVMDGDHWTTISFKQYNTIELWWLVCKFNNVIDPTVSPVAGEVIKLPTASVVNTIVQGLREG